MIRRHVQGALDAAHEAGDDDAGRAALRKIDFVLRPFARRRYEKALIDAALAANEFKAFGNLEATRHLQRVAAISLEGVTFDATDRGVVAEVYAKLPKVRPSRAPIATILVGFAILLAGAGSYLLLHALPDKPSRAYARPLAPPAAGAYKDGGVPLRDAEIEKLLGDEFTQLVVETSRDRESARDTPERKERTKRLSDAPAFAAHGAGLQTAWRDMLDALDKWTHEPTSGEHFEEINQTLRSKIRAVSDQLVAQGLGYYLEGDVLTIAGGVFPIIYAHRVEEVVFVMAAGKPHRVLSLRRLDHLNIVKSLLGEQSPELGDPVLMLDQIDDHVATKILPVLAPGAPFPLRDKLYASTEEGRVLLDTAGLAVREELKRVLGADADAAVRVATLMQERAGIVEGWNVRVRADGLFIAEGALAQLEGRVNGSELGHVHEIENQIAKLEGPRIASRCHQLVAATIRRHEAQHGLDDERDAPLKYPKQLAEHVGEAYDKQGHLLHGPERVRNELSAYVSQLANDSKTPLFSLWNVAQFAFSKSSWGTPESYAGVLLVEGLARQLDMKPDGPLIHDGGIDRVRIAKLATALSSQPGRLPDAARRLYKELFGEPLVPIVDP